jgi:hypothetical protein
MRKLLLASFSCLALACGNNSVGGADASTAALCMSYCTAIQANCTMANNQYQYSSMADCVASCSHFPAGTGGAQTGNSLACRAYHANAAMADPVTHCVHAGPSGGGVCGNPCDGFCALVDAECPAVYPSAAMCATTCATFATAPAYTAAVTGGNSLSCRIYHATAASTDPTTHCPHTGMTSATCQ